LIGVRADRAAEQRVAVRRGARGLLEPTLAAGAALVVDDDGLAQHGAELLRDQARQHVGGAAGRERHDVR